VMVQILKDMGVTEYEPRVINQMLEFTYRYVTTIIEDAKIYATHAKKSNVDADDIKLAIQCRMDQSFTSPPPRDVSLHVPLSDFSVQGVVFCQQDIGASSERWRRFQQTDYTHTRRPEDNEHKLAEEISWFDSNQHPLQVCLAPPLPDSLLKPPVKKVKFDSSEKGEIFQMLSKKQDETPRTVSASKKTTESTSMQMEKLTSTVQILTLEDLGDMKNIIQKLKALKINIADCRRYSRRRSLKLHGVNEEEGEDLRHKITDILGSSAPKLRTDLEDGIDIAWSSGARMDHADQQSSSSL
ncbi:hypothetical protein GOODEAATRI_018627, partial [Goodea atripinnis]